MELDKQEWEYIKSIIEKNAKMENKLNEIIKAYKNVKNQRITRNVAEAFVCAIGFILGENK